MAIKEPFVFQADSEIIEKYYNNHSNYIIEHNDSAPKEYCIIYCSSNDLYYPNNETAFKESVINKNRYEWYKTRIAFGYKHIFIRDIKKQWYLTGINSAINSFDKLAEFIKKETEGYKIIILGSSAGGFIAVILGQLLNAERIYTFNGQFEIKSLLNNKDAQQMNPILYRNRLNIEMLPYYDTLNFIKHPETIFYFHSSKSKWDLLQNKHLNNKPIYKISFRTSNHGIPFLKSNLPVVLNMTLKELEQLEGKNLHPVLFSLRTSGFRNTIQGLKPIVKFVFNKIYIHTIQKLKSHHK